MITREAFAVYTRKVMEDHAWDGLAQFLTLHDRRGEIGIGTYAVLDLAPHEYAPVMRRLAFEQMQTHPESLPVGYLLQIESWAVDEPGPDASEDDRRVYDDARRNGTFDQLPGAVESATAYTCDRYGRVWSAEKIRGR